MSKVPVNAVTVQVDRLTKYISVSATKQESAEQLVGWTGEPDSKLLYLSFCYQNHRNHGYSKEDRGEGVKPTK